MLAIPAIDLREAHCVQLVGGDYDNEPVRLDDPVDVARRWVAAGFTRLHVVDLDAATGRGHNRDVIGDLLRAATVPMQVGGGVRDRATVTELLDQGAEWVVAGTRAVEDPEWLARMAELAPGRVILAADVRERRVVTSGWSVGTQRDILDVVRELDAVPLAGLLTTAVHREGSMDGPDLSLVEDLVETSPWPVIASGGIGSMNDLRNLDERGVAAAVLGMALYTDALDARVVAAEFAE